MHMCNWLQEKYNLQYIEEVTLIKEINLTCLIIYQFHDK